MAPPTGKLADYARDEFPETWDAISTNVANGDALLTRRVDSVVARYLGSGVNQDTLDERVAIYLGKIITLSLINAGIDYWSKQRISVGARSEAITYKDRAEDLHRLRDALLTETRLLWPEVEPLITVIINQNPGTRSAPRVSEVTTAHTPNPYDFPAKDDDTEPWWEPRRVII
jgi:hypothetical protein